MFCPNCGASNQDTDMFCNSCGSQLNATNSNPTPNEGFTTREAQFTTYSAPIPGGSGYEKKNIALCIILTIVTCGIYGFYWMYTLTEDVNQMSGKAGATSGGMVILLSLITCGIYEWYWLYKQGDTIDQMKNQRGMASSNTGILYLILGIFGLGIVSWALMQNELNNLG